MTAREKEDWSLEKIEAENLFQDMHVCIITTDIEAKLAALVAIDKIINLDYFSIEGREYWRCVKKELELIEA